MCDFALVQAVPSSFQKTLAINLIAMPALCT